MPLDVAVATAVSDAFTDSVGLTVCVVVNDAAAEPLAVSVATAVTDALTPCVVLDLLGDGVLDAEALTDGVTDGDLELVGLDDGVTDGELDFVGEGLPDGEMLSDAALDEVGDADGWVCVGVSICDALTLFVGLAVCAELADTASETLDEVVTDTDELAETVGVGESTALNDRVAVSDAVGAGVPAADTDGDAPVDGEALVGCALPPAQAAGRAAPPAQE